MSIVHSLRGPSRPIVLVLGWAAALMLTLVVVVLVAADVAGAQDPTGNASPDSPVGTVFTVNNTLVTMATGLLVPLLVGLLTHPQNPAWVKVGLAGALSAAANLAAQAIQADGTAVFSQEFALQVAIVFASALGSYFGVWDPLARSRGGLNEALGRGVIDLR
jgi:hypothetical protein